MHGNAIIEDVDLTTGKISHQLFRFTMPILGMNLINQAYGLIDSLIVARFAGERQLGIISSANAVTAVGYCLVNGASAAVSILSARACGGKDRNAFHQVYATCLCTCFLFSILIGAVYFASAEGMLTLIDLPASLLRPTAGIVYIYALSMMVQMINGVFNAMLLGCGDSRSPMRICLFSQGVNIVLDYIVVALMQKGAAGAAWASTASLVLSTCITYIILHETQLRTAPSGTLLSRTVLRTYLTLAVPSVAQQSVMAIGSLFLQKIINQSGLEAINGYTIACSLSNFLLIPVISWTTAYETFASQNLGADENERVVEGYREMMKQGTFVCILLALITAAASGPLVSLYLSDPSSFAYGFAKDYLMILIPNYFFLLLKYGSDAVFKAHLKVQYFTCSSFIALSVRVVLAQCSAVNHGLLSLAWATDAGNLAAYFFCLAVKLHYGWPVLFKN